MQLSDLDFADDLALLPQTHLQIQKKTNSVAVVSVSVSFNILKEKSRILRNNTTCINQITIGGEDLENVTIITYLGCIIDEYGGSDEDVKVWICKARAAYLQLKNI
ncbi:unnamed protein product [Schistosoma margrebowiei]|uniref:Uncharacterized protein n=1 Tax=Schistosoma margrebowiei TaxID=48269 RepID=A0A183LIJ6_9TREM|nr:unnamed protein product [Schistosoma margrebowiei]